ncbi:hypothetical protein PIROE2DRAFT_69398 [Piromyces sp. E2]|nr:hypothetical protein PIROE2DRAFT_69398 [Piromyces sp. E2]|eukprot:OUM63309.1 hypothetical protein PIROE2DRAFT_69398 [Piromyces sp. E2]
MLAWIGSIFNRSKSSVELNKNGIQKNDEDWMVVNTDLKSFSESEHNKNKASNNKTSLYTANTLPSKKKNKTATTMAAIGIGQKNSVTDNDLSLLKDKIGMAGINLTGFTNIPLNEIINEVDEVIGGIDSDKIEEVNQVIENAVDLDSDPEEEDIGNDAAEVDDKNEESNDEDVDTDAEVDNDENNDGNDTDDDKNSESEEETEIVVTLTSTVVEITTEVPSENITENNGDNDDQNDETTGNNGDNDDQNDETTGNNGDNDDQNDEITGNNGDNDDQNDETTGNNGDNDDQNDEITENNGDNDDQNDENDDDEPDCSNPDNKKLPECAIDCSNPSNKSLPECAPDCSNPDNKKLPECAPDCSKPDNKNLPECAPDCSRPDNMTLSECITESTTTSNEPEPEPTNTTKEPEPEPEPTNTTKEPEPGPEPTNTTKEPEPEPTTTTKEPEPEPEPTTTTKEPEPTTTTTKNQEPTGGCSTEALGIASKFNAFFFGDFNGFSSDVQGRLAAKGTVNISGGYQNNAFLFDPVKHSKGSNYKCDESQLKDKFKYAIVAGTLNFKDNGEISNGGVAYTNSVNLPGYISDSIKNHKCPNEKKNVIDFDTERQNLINLSKKLSGISAKCKTTIQWGTVTVDLVQGEKTCIVNLDSLENLYTFKINENGVKVEDVTIVFNIKSNSVNFTNFDLFSINKYAPRILWNVPNASKVLIQNFRIQGSLLAPTADIEGNNGNIQGIIIGNSFKGNLEMDWVPFYGCI